MVLFLTQVRLLGSMLLVYNAKMETVLLEAG